MSAQSRLLSALSASLGFLLACEMLIACDETDPGKEPGQEPAADYNPLPDSAEYVYSKEISMSSGMSPNWTCSDTVYRNPLREAHAPGARRFVDSTTFRCKVVDFDSSGTGSTETSVVSRVALDTVSFLDSAEALAMTGADAFLNVALPPGILPRHPDGLLRKSTLITGAVSHFPKRHFPVIRTPTSQDANQDCKYADSGRTTHCREWYAGDFRYSGEAIVFLPAVGLAFVSSGFATAPLGTGPTESGLVRLLYRVRDGDTLRYDGSFNP